jgi:SAM-dependent methyltransferase
MRKPKIETDVRDLGWGSVESQQKRFDAIAGIGIKSNSIVLDVGCGYGDFCSRITRGCYLGIDIIIERISTAIKKYPSEKFLAFACCNIDKVVSIVGPIRFEYVIASGIFWKEERRWLKRVVDTIEKMDVYAYKGIAVNFLSEFALNKKPGRHYATMKEIGEIMRATSQRCTIRHDYLPNDMTLYIYKD